MKCKYCDRESTYISLNLCHSHYNKHKYRIKNAIPVNELRSDFRRITATHCKKCGDTRYNGTTSVLCHNCYLAYTKLANAKRAKKHSKECKKYYSKNKEAISKRKAIWFQKRRLERLGLQQSQY